ncbi:UPF0481 protein [Canna indica]|uniref:UPF0481 protein n=1 Tax=Canna indica TaxID=4628 RepID=A0AAQ3PYM6_9LILI|nr:UPF0481 protein [Canna indica]
MEKTKDITDDLQEIDLASDTQVSVGISEDELKTLIDDWTEDDPTIVIEEHQSKSLDGWLPQVPSHACTIFRVPSYIRERDSRSYEPTIAAIGLFHYQKGQKLSPSLHIHKSYCVSYLITRHLFLVDKLVAGLGTKEEMLEKCLELMLRLEPHARSCYSEDDKSLDRQMFAEMLLRDGCFILQLLLKQIKEERYEEKEEKKKNVLLELKNWEKKITQAPMLGTLWVWNLVVYDLLKLENQIPFFVVQSLFELLKTPADKNVDLVQLALKFFNRAHPGKDKKFSSVSSSQEFHHLLHIFHSHLIPSKYQNMASNSEEDLEAAPDWIPSATLLQDAGIKFRPKKAAETLLDVTFKGGVIEIPSLHVDDSTAAVFRNLIVFEQCYPATRTHITVYAAFMDCIINAKMDVRALNLNGILFNRLGAETDAADLFNKLCDQIHYASDRNYLRNVFMDVTRYYESRWHQWRAALVRNYFSNPWAIISLIAAVILLLLTIEQAVFAGLSYFRLPK